MFTVDRGRWLEALRIDALPLVSFFPSSLINCSLGFVNGTVGIVALQPNSMADADNDSHPSKGALSRCDRRQLLPFVISAPSDSQAHASRTG